MPWRPETDAVTARQRTVLECLACCRECGDLVLVLSSGRLWDPYVGDRQLVIDALGAQAFARWEVRFNVMIGRDHECNPDHWPPRRRPARDDDCGEGMGPKGGAR